MRSNRKIERKPAKRLGAMAERTTSDTPSHARILERFGILDKGAKLSVGTTWSEFLHVASDPEVMKARKNLPKIHKRTNILSSYLEVEAALCRMSEEDILRLRARLIARYTL